jgi:hypothetical protein
MDDGVARAGGGGPTQDLGPWARWCLRAAPWPFLVVALLFMAAHIWQYRLPLVAMVALNYYGDVCLGGFLYGAIVVGRRMQLAVRNSYETRYGLTSRVHRSQQPFWPRLLVIVAATYAIIWSELPMRVGFRLSRSVFDAVADEALKNPADTGRLAGHWAGLYPIAGVEVIGETVVLYVGRDKGNYGFARVPKAPDDLIFNKTGLEDNPHFFGDFPRQDGQTDPDGMRFEGDWFVMYSRYWRFKVGWS